MVACSQIGCAASQPSATDHNNKNSNSTIAVTTTSMTTNMTTAMPFHHPAFLTAAATATTTTTTTVPSIGTDSIFTANLFTKSSTNQRHLSTSSTASDVSESSSSNNNNNNNSNNKLTSNSSSHGSTTSSGRRHGKRQKGQPYIPSYMDLSAGPEPCVVCGDAATGYHYRAMTCEGCKGFFRRTIQKGLKYDCKFGGGCSVDKRTRNQCQQCRYVRCLSVGMAADLVLNEGERIAKRRLIEQNRERRKINSGSNQQQQQQQQNDSNMSTTMAPLQPIGDVVEKVPSIMTFLAKQEPSSQDDQQPITPVPKMMISPKIEMSNSTNYDTVTTSANNNNNNNSLTNEEQLLIDAVVASYSKTLLRLGDHLLKQQQVVEANAGCEGKKSWRQLTELLAPAIVKVVEFAKALPGFAELDNADQVLLLRSGCIEVLCLRVASKPSFKSRLQRARRKEQEEQLRFKEQQQKQQDEMGSLIEPIIEFSSGISKLALDTTETALLAAVLLMQSDRTGLLQPDRVEQCLDNILSAYRKYVCQRWPQHSATSIHWAKILMKVTDVRAISLKYSEKVLSVSVDDSPAPELPSLVLEMLYDDHEDQQQTTPQNNNSTKMTAVSDDYCSSGDDEDRQSTTNNITSASSYASSSHSPFTTSDIPSSPLSYAGSSSSSGSGRPAVPSVTNQTTATTLSHLWHPASPAESHAESVISSSSGSGRSALSPPPPPQPAPQPLLVDKTSTFALHQLASIALDPSFYRPFIAATQAWPTAALFLPQSVEQQTAKQTSPTIFAAANHSQILAAAAAAALATSSSATNQQQSETTTTTTQPKPGSLKTSKYSISSLIA